MKYRHLVAVALALLFSIKVSGAGLDEILEINEKKIKSAQKSQEKIDRIAKDSQQKLARYRELLKQIEGLEIYNKQLAMKIDAQQELISGLDQSLSESRVIERQLPLLISKIADSLEQFIHLDWPFSVEERYERMARIREQIDAADIDVADQFQQLLNAYQIENEYGRRIDHFSTIVELEGQDYEVDVLRVGRIAMVCQTKDKRKSAYWNHAKQQWQILSNTTYRNAIRNGIKMANKQSAIDLLELPITFTGEMQ